MKKVIFLDIDGVLNSFRSVYAHNGYPLDFSPKDLKKFDWVAVGLVKKIAEISGADIVLSSSWRKFFTTKEIEDGLGIKIVGKTPDFWGSFRGDEIKAWLKANPDYTCYCIIDDDSDMLPEQASYFVHTSGYEGFTFKDAVRACNILGCSIYDAVKKPEGKDFDYLEDWTYDVEEPDSI